MPRATRTRSASSANSVPAPLYSFARPADKRSSADRKEGTNRVEHLPHQQGPAVPRLDARARHRRCGARRDPADRVPRPVPLERQRLDGAEPRARREEPDPEGHLGHGDRREAALPGGDALEGRPQGRRDLRPGVPQRPRRGRGHLPRPADHDRRPQRRPDGRDPDAAHRKAARRRDPGDGRPAASSATSRAATASTSTTRRG